MAVTCSRDHSIKVWDIYSGYCVRTISNAHTDWIRSVSSSDDGAWYLSAGNDQVFQTRFMIEIVLMEQRLREFGMHKVKLQSSSMNYVDMSM